MLSCTLLFDGGQQLPTVGEARITTAQGIWVVRILHIFCSVLLHCCLAVLPSCHISLVVSWLLLV